MTDAERELIEAALPETRSWNTIQLAAAKVRAERESKPRFYVELRFGAAVVDRECPAHICVCGNENKAIRICDLLNLYGWNGADKP